MESYLKLVTIHSSKQEASHTSQPYQHKELIERAQEGDKQAFKAIYDEYLPKVYGLCYRLCGDKSQAEDATQEVFIQLWHKIGNFNGQSKFSTWLYSVTSNITISYIRKQKGWWQKMLNIDDSSYSEQKAESSMYDTDLEKWINQLPERARWVFVLYAIEGYRHEQIAEMLDIAIGTSKAQLHRAKQLIEEWMNE